MNKVITDEEYEIVDQKRILIKLKLDIYDSDDNYIASITGGVINGSANIDADSDIRRTFSLTLTPEKDENYLVDDEGYIWVNRLIRVSIGIVNERTNETYWWKFGKFVFTNANSTYDATTNQLTINCSDLVSNLDGSKNGELGQLSIVFPAYKEFRTDVDDVFYSTDITYANNIYKLKMDNYSAYGLSDFFVTSMPATNADEPYMQINSLMPLPIVDKEKRNPLKAGVLEFGKFYAFFIDADKIVYCSNGSLDSEASKDYVASGIAEYRSATMESVPHYSFEGINGEPQVGDMFLMHSEQLTASDDYVLPRIPLIEFDTGNRYPILFYTESNGYSNYYTYPRAGCYPEEIWGQCFNDFTASFSNQGHLRGQKWSFYHYRKTNNNCDPLLYVESGETVYQRMIFMHGRGEDEGEQTSGSEKLKITFIDDYSYTAEWTRKVKRNGKKVTVTETDYRTTDIYNIDKDYIRQFSKVILINLPGKIDTPNETYYNYFTYYWHTILKKDLESDPHFLKGTVRNTIQSRNEYKVSIPGYTTLCAGDSITCKINKSFGTYDEWYLAGMPWKQNPFDKDDDKSIYWYEGVGGVPQTFPWGDKGYTEDDFYVDSSKKVPLKLNINNKYFLNIVDEDMNPLDPSDIKDEERTYVFLVDKRKQYAIKQISTELPDRPLIQDGVPINYYTIRKAVLTAIGQLAHIKRDTCEVDDIGEIKGLPEYNDDYVQYREENPLWDNIPYDLEFSHGDTVWAILQKLRDLYPNYEMYFDENGTFCTNMIPTNNEDEMLIPEKFFQDNIISENTSVDLTTVRNVCHAWGQVYEPDFYCDNGIYTDGSEQSKYVDIYDLNDNTDYAKIVVTCFDAGTNTYTCNTDDIKVDNFYNTDDYFMQPYFCMYTTLPRLSTGTPVYIKYNYTYNSDGSIKKVTEEAYEPDEETPEFTTYPSFVVERKDGDETITYPRTTALAVVGDLKINQNYELLMHKYTEQHISSSSSSGTGNISDDPTPIPPFNPTVYEIRTMTPIRFYEGDNCIVADIPAYDKYLTGDIIAIKMTDTLPEVPSDLTLNINNLGPIPIYDENTLKPIDKNAFEPSITYCFKIKKKPRSDTDEAGAYLLGAWQAQGIAALVDNLEGDPDKPYTTTGGVTVNKYSKEYFQEVYACPTVRLVVMPDSPFTCQKIGEYMSVYIDETNLTSDALAEAAADNQVYNKARLVDSITVTTKLAPFADVNYKVGYRRQDNGEFAPYIIKSVSHDLTGGTTTWQLMRFFPLYNWNNDPSDVQTVSVRTDEENHINFVTGSGRYEQGERVTIGASPKAGYHLDEWEVRKGGVTIEDNEFTMPNRKVVIQAKAAPNVVDITYDANGAGDDPLGETITYGVRTSLNDGADFTNPDITFYGWAENSEAIEPKWFIDDLNSEAFGYADENEYNSQTLYAVWKDSVGLFETGTDNLLIPWSTLVNNGTVTVSNGRITSASFNTDDDIGDLVISHTVNDIYTEAFKGNNGISLTGVTIPDSITFIGRSAFSNCQNITTVVFPDVIDIPYPDSYFYGAEIFNECTSLSEINIPNGVTYLPQKTFYQCESLSHIELPDSIITIRENTFNGTALYTVETSAQNIYNQAFGNCNNLTEITLTNLMSFKYENYGAVNPFYGSDNLETCNLLINPNANENRFPYEASFGYSPNLGLRSGGHISTVNFLEGTEFVPNNMFNYEDNYYYDLTTLPTLSVNYPTTLKRIGVQSFKNSNIHELNFEGCNEVDIGDYAFSHCENLSVIDGLEDVSKIETNSFEYCNSLTEVIIPSNVELLGDESFSFCSNLTSFVIEEGITQLTGYGLGVLECDDNLTYVQIPDSLTDSELGGMNLFWTDWDDKNHYPLLLTAGPIGGGYNVEFGYESIIPPGIFRDLHHLSVVNLPNTITQIGEGAFEYCGSLPTISIPNNVTIISDDLFYKCTNLSSITLPGGIVSIGEYAFCDCTSLLTINYGGTKSAWNNITKATGTYDSFYNVPRACVVHCTDGDIPLF